MKETLNDVASGERSYKHIEITEALNKLDRELEKTREFIEILSQGPMPTGEGPADKEPEPSFLQVYSNIAERVTVAAEGIATITKQIREMLL